MARGGRGLKLKGGETTDSLLLAPSNMATWQQARCPASFGWGRGQCKPYVVVGDVHHLAVAVFPQRLILPLAAVELPRQKLDHPLAATVALVFLGL